jgi:hypothetical protein
VHAPSVLCRPRGHAADVRTNANTHTPEGPNPSALPVQPHTYPCAHSRSISACIRVVPTGTAQEFVSVSPISQRSAAAANPNASAHVVPPKPSDARSNHLGSLDPHHFPALAWSPLSFLCAVTVVRRHSRVVAMVTPPPFRPTAVAWTSVCASVRPCLVQPRTHVPVPNRATMHALSWRGQGQTFGSLSRQTLSTFRPATGRGFAANGDPSRECERQLDPVLAHLLRRMSAPTQPSPCTPRTKPKHTDRDHPVSLLRCRGRLSA